MRHYRSWSHRSFNQMGEVMIVGYPLVMARSLVQIQLVPDGGYSSVWFRARKIPMFALSSPSFLVPFFGDTDSNESVWRNTLQGDHLIQMARC